MIESQIQPYGDYIIHPKLLGAEALNAILRGEISAVEAYKQVIQKFKTDPEHVRLLEFLNFHESMVRHWSGKVARERVKPEESSGLWGLVVEAFVGTAKLLGDTTSILSLKKGEEHGVQEYRNFLENEYVSFEDKKFVMDTVIPKLEAQITSLEAIKRLQ